MGNSKSEFSAVDITGPGQLKGEDKPLKGGGLRYLTIPGPIAFFLGLAVVFTWPLILNLGDRGISARSADLWQNLWNLWWVKHALFELHTNPFSTNLLFYPDTPSLYLHALNPLDGLISSPLQLLFGLVASLNLMELLAFTFSGYTAFLLARYLKLSIGSALLAGTVYAFSPIISTELDFGQLEQLTQLWLPLYILFFLKALDPPAATGKNWLGLPLAFWKNSLLAALAILLTALTTWYYALDLMLFAGLAGLVYLVRAVRARDYNLLKRLVGLALLCTVALAPLAFLTARAAAGMPTAAARSSSIRFNSATLLYFLLPGDSTLWFSQAMPGQEFSHFLGFGTLLLATLGTIFCWKKARGWFFLALFFLVLALGPQFKTGQDSYLDIPLPGALMQALPVIGTFFRVPVRLVAFAMLPLGLLAGWGLDRLAAHKPARLRLKAGVWPVALAVVALLIVFLEYLPGPRTTVSLALDRAAWQKIQPPGAVLSLPYSELGGILMYEQTAHGQPAVGGYLARTPGFDFIDQAPIVRELTQGDFTPSPEDFVKNDFEATLVPALNVYGIRYVVIHRDKLSRNSSDYLDQILNPLLENNPPIARDDGAEIYRVPDYNWNGKTVAGWIDRGKGWLAQENNAQVGPYYWSEGDSTLTLLNPNPQPVKYRIEWTIFSLQKPRIVRLKLNNFAIGQKEVSPTPGEQAFEVELPPGRSTLSLVSSEPALRPSDLIPGSTDTRQLSFAIARLKITAA